MLLLALAPLLDIGNSYTVHFPVFVAFHWIMVSHFCLYALLFWLAPLCLGVSNHAEFCSEYFFDQEKLFYLSLQVLAAEFSLSFAYMFRILPCSMMWRFFSITCSLDAAFVWLCYITNLRTQNWTATKSIISVEMSYMYIYISFNNMFSLHREHLSQKILKLLKLTYIHIKKNA